MHVVNHVFMQINIKDGSEVFEDGVTFITPNFEIALEEASTNTTGQVMRITSAYAELKLLIE